MPDIRLKDRDGTLTPYYGVNSLTVPSVIEGETVTFSVAGPSPTAAWYAMQAVLADSNYTKYTCTLDNGVLISANITDFGLWWMTEYDAVKVSDAVSKTEFMYKVNADCLLSGTTPGMGIWLFDAETQTISQVYSTAYYWRYFQDVGDGCLISGTSQTGTYSGIVFYDYATKAVTKVYDPTWPYYGWSQYTFFEEGCLIGNGDYFGLVWFDYTTHIATNVFSQGANYVYKQVVDGGLLLSSSSTGSMQQGIVFFNLATKTATRVLNTGSYRWEYFCQVTGGWLIGSYSSTGVAFFSDTTKTATMVYSTASDWRYFQAVDGGALIGCYSSAGVGVLFFDSTTLTVTQVYATSYGWAYYYPVDGGCLIGGTRSGTGLLFFDYVTRTVSKISTTSYRWAFFKDVDGGCIISPAYGGSGILFYDTATKVVSLIYSGGNQWQNYQPVTNGYLITAKGTDSTRGILFYNETAKTITLLHDAGYNWIYFQPVSGGVLCACDLTNNTTDVGIVFFDSATDTLTQVYSKGIKYDTFEEDPVNDGWIIYNSVLGFVRKLFWSNTLHTITEI